jgi:hypothetical protein
LLETTDCHVVVCGRSQERTVAYARSLAAGERVSVAVLDRTHATPGDIRRLNLFCIIDAAGPFQGSALTLAQAAIEAGVHYIDLADARDFVARFGTLDAAAAERGVLAVTGASSTPALSNAVLDEVCRGWKRIDSIEIAISPGAQAPLGLSVMRAVLSYAGKPVKIWRHGRWEFAPGWGLMKWLRVPGLARRFVSLVETPDLDIVPVRFAGVRSVLFRAGVELWVLHLGLWLLSLPVRLGIKHFLEPLAELLHGASGWFRRFGSDRGAMTVEAIGLDGTGQNVRTRWTLVAEAGDGPEIPALPALCVVKALLDGSLFTRGAKTCVGLVPLAAIEDEFRRFEIRISVETTPVAGGALFPRSMAAFAEMPAVVREAHIPDPATDLAGDVETTGPETWVGRIIAWFVGFPSKSGTSPALVTIERDGEDELWVRRFGAATFQSRLSARGAGQIAERFGLITFDLDARADERGFSLAVARARLGELPLPRFLTPVSDATARADDEGRYRFDVTIKLPLIGRLVRYRGALTKLAAGGAGLRA